MNVHHFGKISVLFLAICFPLILFVDRPLALFLHTYGSLLAGWAKQFTALLEMIFFLEAPKFIVPGLFLLTGLIFHIYRKNLLRSRTFTFIGLTLLFTRYAIGTLKTLFDRVRPYDYVEDPGMAYDFFVDGSSSFPSGHASFYFALFIPLMFLFPRWRWYFFAFAVIASLSRVFEGDHYLSDVVTSGYIAFVFTYASAKICRIEWKSSGEVLPE
ncbi:MAG: phosphatase PAP2 family protein [Ignavibacteriales bacterium]|nr:phosphatase PAP2 family protein [Ignavibacteriales bacterium]